MGLIDLQFQDDEEVTTPGSPSSQNTPIDLAFEDESPVATSPAPDGNLGRMGERLSTRAAKSTFGLGEMAARQDPSIPELAADFASPDNAIYTPYGLKILDFIGSNVTKGVVDLADMFTEGDVREDLINANEIVRKEADRVLGSPEMQYTGGPGARFGWDVAEATVNMVPALAAGWATRNPGVTLGIMGLQVAGDSYSTYMEKTGGDHKRSMAAAKFNVAAEIIPETIPVLAFLRRAKIGEGVMRMLEGTVGEGAQEVLTSILNQAYDSQELEGMSLKEAIQNIDWSDVVYEGLIGLFVGGILSTPGAIADKFAAPPPVDPLVPPVDPLVPDFEVKPIEENETVIDEAIANAPPPKVVFDKAQEDATLALTDVDEEQRQIDDENNRSVFNSLRNEFPDLTDDQISSMSGMPIPMDKPPGPPLEVTPDAATEDLGWTAPVKQEAPEEKVTSKPAQPQETLPGEDVVTTESSFTTETQEKIKKLEDIRRQITDIGSRAQNELDAGNQKAGEQLLDEQANLRKAATTLDNEINKDVETATTAVVEPETTDEQTQADEITRDEVVAATEPVEQTGEAIDAAETFRTARPEFKGLILSFKPQDDRNGETTPHFYGEIADTEDADGMPVDVVLNKDYDSEADTPVFMVNQNDWDTGKFRQHKVMAGFDTAEAAEKAYGEMWDSSGFGSIYKLSPDEFKQWLAEGDTKVEYLDESQAELKAMSENRAGMLAELDAAIDETTVRKPIVLGQKKKPSDPSLIAGKPTPAAQEYLGSLYDNVVQEVYGFTEEFLEETIELPLFEGERVLMNQARNDSEDFAIIELELAGSGSEGILIKSIRSSRHGKGNGKNALDKLIELSNKYGVDMQLVSSAYGELEGRLSQKALDKWYVRNGFEPMEGYDDMFIYRPDSAAKPTVTPAEGETQAEADASRAKADRSEQQRIRQTERTKQNTAVDPTSDDLITFLRKLGGINVDIGGDFRGQLSGLDRDNRTIGLKGIEQSGPDNEGLSLDQAAEAATEANYLNPGPQGYDATEFSALLDRAAAGEKIYSQQNTEAGEARAQAEYEAEEEKYLGQLKADADDMTAYIVEQTGGPRFSSEDIPDLISQAADKNYGAVLDVTGDDTLSEDEVRTKLQEIIDGTYEEQAPVETAAVEGAQEVPESAAAVPQAEPEAGAQAESTNDAVETELARVKTKLENMSMTELKALAQNAGLRQAGNQAELVDRILTSYEIIERIGKSYNSEDDIMEDAVSGVIDRDDLYRYAQAIGTGNKKIDRIGTWQNGRAVYKFLARVMGPEAPEGISEEELEARVGQKGKDLEARYPKRDAVEVEAVTDLNIGPFENVNHTMLGDSFIGSMFDYINAATQDLAKIGYTPEEVLNIDGDSLPQYLLEPRKDLRLIADFQQLNTDLQGISSGGRKTGTVLTRFVKLGEEINAFKGQDPRDYIRADMPWWAEKMDAENVPAEEQGDLIGKTEDEIAQQAIEDERLRREGEIPTERPAEAQGGDDLFAAGGELEPDLFAQKETPILETREDALALLGPLIKKTDPDTRAKDKADFDWTGLYVLSKEQITKIRNIANIEMSDSEAEAIQDMLRWYVEQTIGDRMETTSRQDLMDMGEMEFEWFQAAALIFGKEAKWSREKQVDAIFDWYRSQPGITSLQNVLKQSIEPLVDSKPLNKIRLSVEIDDEKITQNAKKWVNDIDTRIEKINKLRTCV